LSPSRGALSHEEIERHFAKNPAAVERGQIKEVLFLQYRQVKRVIADGHSHCWAPIRLAAEDAIREVLNREMRLRLHRNEGPQGQIAGVGHSSNPSFRKSSRGSSKLQLPNDSTACRRASAISAVVARKSRHWNSSSVKTKLAGSSSSRIARTWP